MLPKGNPANIASMSDLAKPGVKIVIGEQSVPVGNYTLQVLDKMANDTAYGPDFKNRVLSNVVSREPNVNNVVTKVVLGEPDAETNQSRNNHTPISCDRLINLSHL